MSDRPSTPILDRVHVPADMKQLTDAEFRQLISFLKSLSEPRSLGGKLGRPEVVPSFLALD